MDVDVSRTWDEWWIDALKERNKALEALAESRARFGDSEARIAELEAVIEKALTHWDSSYGDDDYAIKWMVAELRAAPSVVLEDRDREVAARAWDEGYAHAYSVGVQEGATGFVVEYVAPNPYRKGDTNA